MPIPYGTIRDVKENNDNHGDKGKLKTTTADLESSEHSTAVIS